VRRVVLFGLIVLLHAFPLKAQGPWTAKFGGGVGLPVNATKDHAHNGFTFVAAAGMRLRPRLNALLQFSFDGMNVTVMHNATPISNVNATMYLWGLTLNPEFQFIKKERFSSYATGGYGLYSRWLELTNTSFGPTTVCDGWWDVCTNSIAAIASFVNGNTTYSGGYNVGVGVTYGERLKFFAEGSYHHMFTANQPTEVIPIVVGVRW
jgi:hypothetical protein